MSMQFQGQSNNTPPEQEHEQNSLLNESSRNLGMMNGLNISAQKLILPGLCLVKTESEALIVHNKEPINLEGKTNKELIEMLRKDPDQKDSVYIDMGDMEKKFMKGGLLEDSGEVPKDEKEMKQMFYNVQQKHPRKIVNGIPQKLPICIKTGWFCGCKKCKKSKISPLGIGMVVYFKFLKTFILAYFFIAILNAFLVASYYKNNSAKKVTDYKDALYKTTLGNVGSTFYNCEKIDYENQVQNTSPTTSPTTASSTSSSTSSSDLPLTLNCQGYVIGRGKSFGISKTKDDEEKNDQNCGIFSQSYDLDLDENSCLHTKEVDTKISADCTGKPKCTVNIPKSSLTCSNFKGSKTYYFTYYCYNDNIDVVGFSTPFKRQNFSYIIVGVDIISMLILIFVLLGIDNKKKKEFEEFIQKRTFIRDFTLHLKDLRIPRERIKEEINDLIAHFKSIVQAEDPSFELFQFCSVELKKYPNYNNYYEDILQTFDPTDYFVFDVVYPLLTSDKLYAIRKYNNLADEYSQVDEEIGKLTGDCKTQNLGNKPSNLNQVQDGFGATSSQFQENTKREGQTNEVIYKKIGGIQNEEDVSVPIGKSNEDKITTPQLNNPKNQKKLDKLLKKKEELLKKMEEKKEEIKGRNDIKEINEMYITFRNYRIAKFFDSAYRRKRSCCKCLNDPNINRLYYKGQWLNISFAKDEPSNIKWENITFNPCLKKCRTCFSLFLAILLMIVTLFFIICFKYFEKELGKKFNTNVDCTFYSGVTVSDVTSGKDPTKTYCYCYNNLIAGSDSLNSIKGKVGNSCNSFYTTYLKTTAISTALIVIIPLINAIVVIVLKCLTSFQKNRTLSEDMSSNMWKMFVIQFVNSGLLLVLVNMRVKAIQTKIPNFPFFAGDFSDMNPGWYIKVAAVMLFSMILNIATPHIASIGFAWLNCCFRCCDSGCDEGRHTKKKRKKEYYELYTGPVFDMDARYASILSTFFITLIFSPGSPILIILFFFYLLITYFMDKILMLRYYKIPPKFDLHISNMFSSISKFGVVLHFLFALWTYGNRLILVNVTEDKYKEYKTFLVEIVNKITLKHNILMIIFCVILLIGFSIRGCVTKKMCDCSREKKIDLNKSMVDSNVEIGLAIPMKDLYKSYSIKKIEYFQSLKDENASANLTDYRQNLRLGINYIRSFVNYKLKKNSQNTIALKAIENNFDEGTAKYPDILNIKLNPIIQGDTSYNLVFIPEFEAVAYFEYLKNM